MKKNSSAFKCPAGIPGFDEITNGGLPRGRATLVCGSAGCGKTIFAIQFLANGAQKFGEPGVYFSFEEDREKMAGNMASLGIDLPALEKKNLIALDYLQVDPLPVAETGEFTLDGLFLRLGHALKKTKARRVVLDSMDAIFGGFNDANILRAELRRLVRWLESQGVTSIITGEKGEGKFSRHGLEEYVADCVVFLDHRADQQISTRRLRVVKYRGTPHSTNEFPFIISKTGISIIPITAIGLDHPASRERISSGIASLDEMFGGKGFYRGSTILVSGTAGTGKSSIAGYFVNGACRRGEKALYFAFEESTEQILRNMGSIGLKLQPAIDRGLLKYIAKRPTLHGLEAHLAELHDEVKAFKPRVVVVDPITNFLALGSGIDVKAMLMRLIDFLKSKRITGMFTSLTEGGQPIEQTDVGVSSLIDTWLLVRDIEVAGERNRGLYVLKSRGMPHSKQIREFVISNRGLDLVPVYVGPSGILVGSARISKEEEEAVLAREGPARLRRQRERLELKRKAVEAEIASIRARFTAEERELENAARDNAHSKMAGRTAEFAYRTGRS